MDKKASDKTKDSKTKTIEKQKKDMTEEKVKPQKKPIQKTKENKKSYVSYERRVLLYFIIVIGCLVLAASFLTKSFSTDSREHITSKENSYVDYKVYLKKNDFYEKNYLDKDMIYVASLIKRIDIKIDYLFNIEEKSNVEFTYDVTGVLSITDTDGKNTFFEKEYELLPSTIENMKSGRQKYINKSISIDYDYYNNIANKFRSDYGIDTKSNLIVYFKVKKKGDENNKFELKDDNSTMSLTIPLSEKAINIQMDYKAINKNAELYSAPSPVLTNYTDALISVALVGVATIFVIPLIKLLKNFRTKKSAYDKYIDKILNEYDRLIVETTTAPKNDVDNVIKVESFEELLDVRDNLSLPIKYYIINKHQKCNFYINHDKELYLLALKAVDFEEDKK